MRRDRVVSFLRGLEGMVLFGGYFRRRCSYRLDCGYSLVWYVYIHHYFSDVLTCHRISGFLGTSFSKEAS